MMPRRSRRLAGLSPTEEEQGEQGEQKEQLLVFETERQESMFNTQYEWAAFVLLAFILPMYWMLTAGA